MIPTTNCFEDHFSDKPIEASLCEVVAKVIKVVRIGAETAPGGSWAECSKAAHFL